MKRSVITRKNTTDPIENTYIVHIEYGGLAEKVITKNINFQKIINIINIISLNYQ